VAIGNWKLEIGGNKKLEIGVGGGCDMNGWYDITA
jgi:hypothetical protein